MSTPTLPQMQPQMPQPTGFVRLERCEKCKFVQLLNGYAECRRFPPGTLMLTDKNGRHAMPDPAPWPRVQPHGWCGEFKQKIAIANPL